MQNQARLQDINLQDGPGGHANQPIGTLLQELHGLTDDQVQQVVRHQQQQGLRFGDAAVALRLATHEDIVVLLARQFHLSSLPRVAVAAAPDGLPVGAGTPSLAEPFRDLRTELIMQCVGPDRPRCALALVSPDRGDGKTFVAANLAAAFSQLGARTLLLEANLRRPGLAAWFGLDPATEGLATLLGGAGVAVLHQVAALPGLFVMPAGQPPPNPQELLQGPGFRRFIDEAARVFDHVILDSPARSLGSDYRTIAAAAGMALAVARQDHTDLLALEQMLGTLENDCAIAGVVLNHRR